MPTDDRELRPQLSVLDRLLDDAPRQRAEVPLTHSQTIRKAKEALRRDLEWLLNTRAYPEAIEEELELLNGSVFTYGLPDFTAVSATANHTRIRLERALKRALDLFEPRLFGVNVEALGYAKGDRGVLQFVISGWFRMSPAPMEVSFATSLELSRGQYHIDGE